MAQRRQMYEGYLESPAERGQYSHGGYLESSAKRSRMHGGYLERSASDESDDFGEALASAELLILESREVIIHMYFSFSHVFLDISLE